MNDRKWVRLYKHRNRIERTIGRLEQIRRIATRYDRIPINYLAGLYLASLTSSPPNLVFQA